MDQPTSFPPITSSCDRYWEPDRFGINSRHSVTSITVRREPEDYTARILPHWREAWVRMNKRAVALSGIYLRYACAMRCGDAGVGRETEREAHERDRHRVQRPESPARVQYMYSIDRTGLSAQRRQREVEREHVIYSLLYCSIIFHRPAGR